MPTAEKIYDDAVRQLPPRERLRLASLILQGLTGPSGESVDMSDSWSDQDLADLTAFSAKQMDSSPENTDA